MKGQVISFIYVLNIVMQSLFTLFFYAAVSVGIGYLLTTYLSCDDWVYIPLILVGLGTGIFSMVKFILTAMSGLERLERSGKGKGGNDGKA